MKRRRTYILMLLILSGVGLFAWLLNIQPRGLETSSLPTPASERSVIAERKNISEVIRIDELTPPVSEAAANFGTSQEAIVQLTGPEGQLTKEFRYQTMTPQGKGRFDLVEPDMRFYLSPSRVIRFESQRGSFYAPENDPQTGTFEGGLLIRLYDVPPKTPIRFVDTKNKPATVPQIQIDVQQAATVDSVRGQVVTDSPIVLTRPADQQLRFEGRGMKLKYNSVVGRIEYLEVLAGKSIHYRPHRSSDSGKTAKTAKASVTQTPATKTTKAHPKPKATSFQYYRLAFQKDVAVTYQGRTIESDQLVVYLSLANDPGSPVLGDLSQAIKQNFAAGATPPSLPLRVMQRALPALSLYTARCSTIGAATTGAVVPSDARISTGQASAVQGSRRQISQKDEALILTWTGRLVMTPIEERPSFLAEGQDVAFHFEGGREPVRAMDAEGRRLTCQSLIYVDSSEHVVAIGRTETQVAAAQKAGRRVPHALQLTSQAIGVVTAPRMDVWLKQHRIQLQGAGQWQRARLMASSVKNKQKGSNQKSAPVMMRSQWSKRVNLFFNEKAGEKKALRSVVLYGDVQVKDPLLAISADQLTVRLATEAAGTIPIEGVAISEIVAAGEVTVSASPTRRLSADSVALTFAPQVRERPVAEGKDDKKGIAQPVKKVTQYVPSRLDADGQVVVIDGDYRLQSDQLAASFLTSALMASSSKVAFDRVAAVSKVQLTLPNRTLLTGQRLIMNEPMQTARLEGSPARVTMFAPKGDSKKEAMNIRSWVESSSFDVQQNGRVVVAQQSGVFWTNQLVDAKQVDRPYALTVRWQKQMQFHQQANQLKLSGQVEAVSELSAVRSDRLTAEQVVLKLHQVEQKKGQKKEAKVAADNVAVDVGMRHRRLHHVFASGGVVLLATQWRDQTHKQYERQLRIEGPTMALDHQLGVAEVIGRGQMLIEDGPIGEHAEKTLKTNPKKTSKKRSLLGHGTTLFTWQGGMRIEQVDQKIAMKESVHMTHKSAGMTSVIEVRSDQIAGRLKTVDEASSKKAGQPARVADSSLAIDQIQAMGHVQIDDTLQHRRITCHQLTYEGRDNKAHLEALPDRTVQVIDMRQPKPMRAASITWDLTRDLFEVRQVDY